MSLNPNTPTLVGTEWFPYRQRGLAIDAHRQWAAVLTPGAVTTDDIAVNLRSVVGSPTVAAEIIKVSELVAPTTTVTTYRPSADGNFTGAAHAGGGTGSPFYVDVDEAVLDAADYVINQATTNQVWSMNYASGGFSTGRRVLSVAFKFYASGSAAGTTVYPWFYNGTSTSYGTPDMAARGLSVTGSSPQGPFETAFDVNPVTLLPWTVADVVALASTSLFGFDLYAPAVNTFKLYQAWIEVTWITENRLAFGSATAADGWVTIPMATAAAADTWTPVAATEYAVILTVNGAGSCSWRALDAGVAHPDIHSAPVTLTNSFPSALGASDTAAPGLVGVDGAGAGVWGQPYVTITEEAVYTGRTVEQEVTLPDTASRGSLKFVCRPESTATTANLLAKLKRRSDNVQVGGTVTVTPFDIRDEWGKPRSVWLPAASGAAGSAAQHYVEWSCTAASGSGWVLSTLDAGVYGVLSVGGNTDQATIAGVETAGRDVPVLVGTTRTAPASQTVTQT